MNIEVRHTTTYAVIAAALCAVAIPLACGGSGADNQEADAHRLPDTLRVDRKSVV